MAWEDLLQRPGQSNGLAEFLLNARQMNDQHAQAAPQLQLLQAKAQEMSTKAARDQQFQTDVEQYLKAPSPQSLSGLMSRYPDKAQDLQRAYSVKDTAQKTSDQGYMGSVYSALNNNRTDLALNLMRQRRDADQAAGLDVTEDNSQIAALEKGDAGAANTVKGMFLAHLAAIDSDKFAATYGAVSNPNELKNVGPGSSLVDPNTGKAIYTAPFAPQYRNVSPGDTLVEVGGGGQASGAPGTGATGPRRVGGYTPRSGENSDAALAGKYGVIKKVAGLDPDAPLGSVADVDRLATAIIASEGKPAAKNNVGNIEDGPFARSQPGYAGKDGRWATFDTPAAGANAVKNLIRRKFANGFGTVRDIIEGKVVGGSAPQAGGATVVATGSPKPQYQMLTPDETQSLGLDPNVKYQRAPDGQITALGGQSKAQLKPIPPQVKDKWITNRNAIRNIDVADKEISKYPNAVGFGTGYLWDPNRTDPKGADARAAISNIGSLIIHDRSGAAVTAAETPRLVPFIPKIDDSAETIKKKLTRLRAEIASINSDLELEYSEDQGYRPFAGASAQSQPSAGGMPRVRSIQEARKLAPGTKFIDPNGVVRTR